MVKCEICGREFGSIKSLSLHVSTGHKITKEEYYLKYINPIKGICKTCGKNTKFESIFKGYKDYCNRRCATKNHNVQEKRKNTYYKKTGYGHPSQNPDTKQRFKETYYERTGYDNPSQNPDVMKKREETWKRKTGYNHPSKNPDIQKKKEEDYYKKTGYNHPTQNPEVAKKISDSKKYTFHNIEEMYPLLIKIENLKEGSDGEILGHCKNANCPNSFEKGGYFIVTAYQLYFRNLGINSTSDSSYFYCCEECKKDCVLFNKSATVLNNIFSPINDLSKASQQDLSIWRTEVFFQQLKNNIDHVENFCEICHSTENLVGHHIQPQKLYPEFALDIDNGIVLCEECHVKYGHTKGTECSTGNLANKICK